VSCVYELTLTHNNHNSNPYYELSNSFHAKWKLISYNCWLGQTDRRGDSYIYQNSTLLVGVYLIHLWLRIDLKSLQVSWCLNLKSCKSSTPKKIYLSKYKHWWSITSIYTTYFLTRQGKHMNKLLITKHDGISVEIWIHKDSINQCQKTISK